MFGCDGRRRAEEGLADAIILSGTGNGLSLLDSGEKTRAPC